MKSFHEISQFDPVLPITITIIDIVHSDEIFSRDLTIWILSLPITITIIDIVRSDGNLFKISQFDPVLPITIAIIDIVRSDEIFHEISQFDLCLTNNYNNN
ncbi:hypothetical protein CEXT_508501 [Caerostris extrusa]|uniref:Uncharacterized protein n=1 Tax=Caerostris extrusa TaxID=172846 RepID=A0AAV4WJG4_CAEEX|nr:hypothetical protein CEXT_508501 [Caerostris extrusa]